jgi:hypothetical protein
LATQAGYAGRQIDSKPLHSLINGILINRG